MSISFIRVDDRMIHGQTCTRWALEYPCDGLIAVNDKAAKTPVLKAAYKNASDKKTFVWSLDEWRVKCGKVLASKDARKVYTNCTAAVLRAKESVLETTTKVQEKVPCDFGNSNGER